MARITKPIEERRQEIIDTSREFFIEHGFDKTQVSDISKKMNVAQGLVYHYFKSKIEILFAVIDEMAEEHVKTTEQILKEHTGTALDCLDILFKKPSEVECYDKLFQSLIGNQAVVEYCSKKMTVSTAPLFTALIERGNADGSWNCEYPKETAVFILQGMSGMVGFYPEIHEENSKIQAFTNIFFRILGIRPPQ